jgi:hypothetical protein
MTTKSSKKEISNYEYDTFVCTKETLRQTLDTYGVAIIPNVLDEIECDIMIEKFWGFFEHITQQWKLPLNRHDKKTWREFYNLFPVHSMLVQHFGFGHALWNIRQNPKIVMIFAYLWECKMEELLASFDCGSMHLPPEDTGKGSNKGNTWYHTDQSYMRPDFECVQSFVTGMDIEDGDATLSIMVGSHKFHKEFKEQFDIKDKKDWFKLTKEQEKFYHCPIANIKCPRGSLVLWDSRTIHCGIESTMGRPNPKIRYVAYLCYMPRKYATDAFLKKKKKAFEELRTMSHHPCKGRLFGKMPQTYGKQIEPITPIERPELSELGMKLAGY